MKSLISLVAVLASTWGWPVSPNVMANDGPAKAASAPKSPPKPTLPNGTPAEQVKELIRQYDQAAADFMKRYKTAVGEAEQRKLVEQYFPDPEDYAVLLVQIAEKTPKSPAALDALLWAGRHSRHLANDPTSPFARAKKALIRDYLDNPKIGSFCMSLRHEDFDVGTLDILRHVWTKKLDRQARALAGFALATVLRSRARWHEALDEITPKQLASLEKAYGKDAIAALRRIDSAAAKKEAEAILVQLAADKKYADALADYGNKKVAVAELARRDLFEIRRLQPGQPAPEIVGEDIDGQQFKLSDYRGKVVLLDFWGNW